MPFDDLHLATELETKALETEQPDTRRLVTVNDLRDRWAYAVANWWHDPLRGFLTDAERANCVPVDEVLRFEDPDLLHDLRAHQQAVGQAQRQIEGCADIAGVRRWHDVYNIYRRALG